MPTILPKIKNINQPDKLLKIKTVDNNHPKIYPEVDYKLKFDGCSKSNPGLAGAGAVIYRFDKEIATAIEFVGTDKTNNVAEYRGLIIGLKQSIEMGIKTIVVEGDSLLVINQMNGVYKVKSDNLIELYNEATQLSKQFDKIIFRHIYRENNRRADELSNLAISKPYLDISSDHDIYDDTDDDINDDEKTIYFKSSLI